MYLKLYAKTIWKPTSKIIQSGKLSGKISEITWLEIWELIFFEIEAVFILLIQGWLSIRLNHCIVSCFHLHYQSFIPCPRSNENYVRSKDGIQKE